MRYEYACCRCVRPAQRRRPREPRCVSRGSTPARALAFVVALLVLLVSLSAEAKKKKPAAKKHKTPAAKSKGKGKEALPAEPSVESDEASSDEKPAAEDDEKSKPAPTPEPEEDAPKPPPKAAKAPPPKESDTEAGGGLVAFRFGIGGRALFRNVAWTGDNGAARAVFAVARPPAGALARGVPRRVRDRRLRGEHRRLRSFQPGLRRVVEDAGRDAR